MATVKMAVSSQESTSFLHSVQQAAKNIYLTLTFFNGISDDTLNVLVGLCAGHGALLSIERKQALKLLRRLSASQTHMPILDDATWAADVGGSVVGEVEGHCSYLKPWAEPNFGVKFLYRRIAKESIPNSLQDPKCFIYPHDGTLHGALLRSPTSTASPCTEIDTSKAPNGVAVMITTVDSSLCPLTVSPKIWRSPLPTPTSSSNSTSKKLSSMPKANESARRPSLIPLPTSPAFCRLSPTCADIFLHQNTSRPQVFTNQPNISSGSPGLLTILFSQKEERTRNSQAEGKGACPNKPLPEKVAEELECTEQKKVLEGGRFRITEVPTKGGNSEDSDDNMGSIEVEKMLLQQSRRLLKAPYLPTEFQRPVKDRKSNKIQPRVNIRGATRGSRVTFREREPARRQGPAPDTESKAA